MNDQKISPKADFKTLQNSIPQVGEVTWIGVRPGSRQPVKELEKVMVSEESGLDGDRFKGGKRKNRQVTLIQEEHLEVVAKILNIDQVHPALLRRNIVVKGINLLSLMHKNVQIGNVILKVTGNCHPCSRMEENLGEGGYNAMRGHGGITAEVIQGGEILVGEKVSLKSTKKIE
ncbi:MOSC domain-containing protein [Flexithrix dorotheae]|uniref:MOSC domain-containing protein n=1 Tax=Flexithrix dorotheae TaxID=70993 RepID=UPI0003641D24|nr:MOSC domain-containing protein [Flexithrix dorotheae]